MEIENELKEYIIDNFMFADDDGSLTSDASLFDNGIIDSTGVLDLVSFIEETYEIQVDDTDLVPENFDSLSNIKKYIESRLA